MWMLTPGSFDITGSGPWRAVCKRMCMHVSWVSHGSYMCARESETENMDFSLYLLNRCVHTTYTIFWHQLGWRKRWMPFPGIKATAQNKTKRYVHFAQLAWVCLPPSWRPRGFLETSASVLRPGNCRIISLKTVVPGQFSTSPCL